ncbi:hypothetical protein HMPREF9372_3798 [Sporosarcina newyorkensis 2681]|uniref:Uncharacterized protein n=1 Tax=Sporosarcina newyorkensis 2681 TaxID=1027292 RepID=F9DYB7_9BACL|nr:hypothetical protein HMPREF9372_3798 [Sporosarcina newyorkensis 2681]
MNSHFLSINQIPSPIHPFEIHENLNHRDQKLKNERILVSYE